MSDFCLEPMTVKEIETLLGKNFAKTFQKEMDLIVQPLRKYIAKGYPLALGKEQWEYVVTESIPGAEWCGAGKSIIDVKIGDAIGCDVKGVGITNDKSTATAEASMFQSFKSGTNEYFKQKDKKSLWNLFVDGWLQKVKTVENYYLIGIIRKKDSLNCSLCCFKVKNAKVDFDDDKCQFLTESMRINGLGNPEYIDTRIYRSKTRLEIKFKKPIWQSTKYSLPIYKFND